MSVVLEEASADPCAVEIRERSRRARRCTPELARESKRAVAVAIRAGLRRGSFAGQACLDAAGVMASEPELANACLVEAEVVANLMTHRLDDVHPEAIGIVPEVAHERVAKDQDLIRQATAPEERGTTQLGADVHAIRVVLGAAVGNDG